MINPPASTSIIHLISVWAIMHQMGDKDEFSLISLRATEKYARFNSSDIYTAVGSP
jgi:hypothetical protein